MKTIVGINGIIANATRASDDSDIEHVIVELDKDSRAVIDFIQDFQRISGFWYGSELARCLTDLQDFMEKYQDDQQYEAQLRLNNPAVAESYQHYKTMLALAKEESNG